MRTLSLYGRVVFLALVLLPSALQAQSDHPVDHSSHAAETIPWEPPLRIVNDSSQSELVIELGPFDMAADLDHHDQPQPLTRGVDLPIDAWLHGFEIEIIDRFGEPVPQTVLHHINVIAANRRELFSGIMLRVAAAGQETGPAILPRLIGMRVHEGEEFLVSTMLHNPTPHAYQGVVVRVRMPYTKTDRLIRPLAALPFYLDVMPPAGETHAYDIPPGRSEKSWEGSPAVAGRILGVGGHLHRYGVALILEDRSSGKVIWEASPVLDEGGDVIGMPIKKFFWRLGIPLRPDRTYRLTAVYDNPTGETIPEGAMGTLGGVFLPKRGESWPEIDPADPDYQLDLWVTRGVGSESVGSAPLGSEP